jgi:eukaryotic-like serine/threonine-protein kinase
MVAQSMQADLNSDRGCFTASGGNLLAYHSGLNESQLSWFDRAGNRVGRVGEPGFYRGVRISPDGKRASAIVGDLSGRATVWIYEFTRSIKQRFGSGDAFNMALAWSSDSRRIALGARRDGAFCIYAKEVVGAGVEELLFRSTAEFLLWTWQAHGSLVLSIRNPRTGFDIYQLPPAARGSERLPVPVVVSDGDQMEAIVSPDGRWVVYISDESGDGVTQPFVAVFPGGGNRRQVAAVEVNQVRWNPNGKEIFLASRRKLMAAEVRVAGNAIEIGAPRLLFEMPVDCNYVEISCMDVAPDGDRFLILERTGSPPPVALIQNWTAALKK